MEKTSEARLVEKAKHDSKAFSQLYDTYYTPIYRYVLHRTGDVPIALDLTSNVFFKALKGIKTYTWRDIPFSAWLYKIAGNEINEYFRKKKKAPISLEKLLVAYDFEPVSLTDLQEEIIAAEEEVQKQKDFLRMYQSMQELELIYQEVLTLRFLEKKKIKEIAMILGRSEGTIKSQLSRGTQLLREKLTGGKKKKEKVLMQPIPSVSIIKVGE